MMVNTLYFKFPFEMLPKDMFMISFMLIINFANVFRSEYNQYILCSKFYQLWILAVFYFRNISLIVFNSFISWYNDIHILRFYRYLHIPHLTVIFARNRLNIPRNYWFSLLIWSIFVLFKDRKIIPIVFLLEVNNWPRVNIIKLSSFYSRSKLASSKITIGKT